MTLVTLDRYGTVLDSFWDNDIPVTIYQMPGGRIYRAAVLAEDYQITELKFQY